MSEIGKVRLRMSVWFVASTGVVLLGLAALLFVLLVRERSNELTRGLERATSETIKAAAVISAEQRNPTQAAAEAVAELNTPYMPLYLFDGSLRYIGAAQPPPAVFAAARHALRDDLVREHFTQNDQTWRVVAQALTVRDQLFAVVAVADESVLDRQYVRLLELFGLAGLGGILLLGVSSYYFAGRAVQPIQANADATRRFMTDAAHELRTPVATLRTNAEVALQRSDLDDRTAATLHTIVDESTRLSALVADLLTLARADAGERVLLHEIFYLDDVVSDAMASVAALARSARVHLAQRRYEQARMSGDSRLVRQLIVILLDNALKYTPAGGTITTDVFAEGNDAILAVSDSGIGIEPAALPHIFERFYRSDRARQASTGAGLGLSIGQWIAELHGARIAVESAPKQGTTIQVRFPAAS